MWKIFQSLVPSQLKKEIFIKAKDPLHNQIRTTFILKRINPPKLHRKGESPKKLRRKHYIYELVKDTNTEKLPQIEVVLKSYVEGLGNVGDKITVNSNYAYDKLLLPGLAVYATPNNIKKYETNSATEKQYSSAYALYAVRSFQRILLSVVMNMQQPWTIKPWHIKTSFRKCGYIVPEYAITLPEQPISGPDMNLENKEFYVTVTINKTEKVDVRCRIHHWSTNLSDRIPYVDKFWNEDVPAILPEQASILESLPKKKDIQNRTSIH